MIKTYWLVIFISYIWISLVILVKGLASGKPRAAWKLKYYITLGTLGTLSTLSTLGTVLSTAFKIINLLKVLDIWEKYW